MRKICRRTFGRFPLRIVALVATTALVAACQPGWTNPYVGSGDGTGSIPGATSPANADVSLQTPTSVVAIPAGGFFVYDSTRCAIYRVSGSTTGLYAGTPGTCGDAGDGGPATQAEIDAQVQVNSSAVASMALDGSGNLYFPGQGGATLRRVDASTGVITSITLPTDPSNDRVLAGLASDTDGSVVFLAEDANVVDGVHLYRLASGGSYSSVYSFNSCSNCHEAGLANIGPGTFVTGRYQVSAHTYKLVRISVPHGTSVGASDFTGVSTSSPSLAQLVGSTDGSFYAADAQGYPNQVVRIDPDNKIAVVAGTGAGDPGTSRQTGLATDLSLSPTGLAVTPNSGLLIASGHVVYRLDQAGQAGHAQLITGFVEPVVDSPLSAPGPLVALPESGSDPTYFVEDTTGCHISKVEAGVATTFAGTGTCGDSGDGAQATNAEIAFGFPSEPGVDAAGNLYFIQDMGHTGSHVRKVSPGGGISTVPGTTFPSGTVLVGLVVFPDGSMTLNATDAHSNWLVRQATDGTESTIMTYGTSLRAELAAQDENHYVTQNIDSIASPCRLDVSAGTIVCTSGTVYASPLNGAAPLVAAADGTIYAIDGSGYVVRVDPSNAVTRIAGDGVPTADPEPLHGYARSLPLVATGLALTADGDLLISSGSYVYRLANPKAVSGN